MEQRIIKEQMHKLYQNLTAMIREGKHTIILSDFLPHLVM